jgi:RecA/RadA recombinase
VNVKANKEYRDNVDAIESAVHESRTSRMSVYDIGWLMMCAARVPQLLIEARKHIQQRLFKSSESGLVLFWRAVCSAADDTNGSLPADPRVARELIALKANQVLNGDPTRAYFSVAAEKLVFDPNGMLDDFVSMPVSVELEDKAFELLAAFIRERVASDPIRRAIAGLSADESIGNIELVLSAIENKARSLIGLSVDPGSPAVVKGYVPTGRRCVTTKMAFLDRLMGGGQADGEAYAVLGPSSGGKSALMVQVALESSELEAAAAFELGEPKARNWYYFSWELTEAQLRERVYTYGAKISFDSLKLRANHGTPYSTATDMSTVKEYEHDPYVNSPGNPFQGEIERIERFEAQRYSGIGANFKIVDYSSFQNDSGGGGFDEIVAYLKREIARGERVGGVVIDYAGLVAERYVAQRQLDPDSVYQVLSSFGSMCRSRIAIPFTCRVWALHQLKGESAKRKYGQLHYSDAKGCRNFADNFDFSIEFGMYSPANGLVRFSSTKHRHASAVSDGVFAKFDSRFGAFVATDKEYAIDPMTGNPVEREHLDRVFGGASGAVQRSRGAGVVDPNSGMD